MPRSLTLPEVIDGKLVGSPHGVVRVKVVRSLWDPTNSLRHSCCNVMLPPDNHSNEVISVMSLNLFESITKSPDSNLASFASLLQLT